VRSVIEPKLLPMRKLVALRRVVGDEVCDVREPGEIKGRAAAFNGKA